MANENGHVAAEEASYTIQQAHDKLGHANESSIQKTARHLGRTIKRGALKPCEACSVAKAKHKALLKHPKLIQDVEKMMYLDIQMFCPKPKEPAYSQPHMCIRVVDPMQLKYASFCKTKNGIEEPAYKQLHHWKEKGLGIDTI